ncbi:tetratricopeptide repeat protein [Streptomyces sp. HPF1205]|uniref:tetratricopeptide repeat protein n=1 Tax=Streptomyces sp. HPF1205 TaxID=2873262 RepID=UPI001CEC8576|nr:tetratricopeptide repeat protein [Streptomyces sp. HPF1205]
MTDQALDASPAGEAAASVPAGHARPGGPAATAATVPSRLPPRPDTAALPPLPAHFVGRERELAELRAEIARPGLAAAGGRTDDRARVLLVAGRPGAGRTCLALALARTVADDYPDGQCFVSLTTPEGEPVTAEEAARRLLRTLAAAPAAAKGAGESAGESVAARPTVPQGRVPARDTDASAPDGEAASGEVAGGKAPGGLTAGPGGAAGSGGRESTAQAGRGPGGADGGGDTGRAPGHKAGALARGGRDTGESAVEALRRAVAGRRVLFVLDDAVNAGHVAPLLPSSPGSLVVVTSGGPLSTVPDVRPCTLGGLDTPAAVALLARTLGSTRVTNDPRAAETLVQEAGGHPTALRLVGAWLAARPRLSMAEAARRLRDVSDAPVPAPSGEPREAEPKGSSPVAPSAPPAASAPGELLRAFRLVHAELPGPAARMLRLLVLAPAAVVDAQVASALAGCSVQAAQSTLDDFVAGGLLARAAPGRYRVPRCLEPMLRAELAAHDRPEEVQLARARMLERTVRQLHSCRAALAGEPPGDGLPRNLRFDSADAAALWLRERLPALLASARVAVADGGLDTLARRLIAAVVRALLAYPGGGSTAAERYELHRLVLDVAERRGLHREKAAALINIADIDAEAGRPRRALETYRNALDAARAGDDSEAEGRALEALGCTYLELQDLPRASDWFGRALALRQARGELAHQARLHARIGSLLTYLGRYGPALREWRSAAGVHRRLGDLPAQARALTEVARVQEYAGHPEDALRTCRDALYWARQAGERRLEAAVLLRLADTLDRLGDPGGARLQRAAAAKLFRPGELPAF